MAKKSAAHLIPHPAHAHVSSRIPVYKQKRGIQIQTKTKLGGLMAYHEDKNLHLRPMIRAHDLPRNRIPPIRLLPSDPLDETAVNTSAGTPRALAGNGGNVPFNPVQLGQGIHWNTQNTL
jgi:hypothetical protein